MNQDRHRHKLILNLLSINLLGQIKNLHLRKLLLIYRMIQNSSMFKGFHQQLICSNYRNQSHCICLQLINLNKLSSHHPILIISL